MTRDLHLTAQEMAENTGLDSSFPAPDIIKPQPTVGRENSVEVQARGAYGVEEAVRRSQAKI